MNIRRFASACCTTTARVMRRWPVSQYAGPGQLLPILEVEYVLGQSRGRLLNVLLRQPAALNLRSACSTA